MILVIQKLNKLIILKKSDLTYLKDKKAVRGILLRISSIKRNKNLLDELIDSNWHSPLTFAII